MCYYGGLYLRSDPDNIRRTATPAVFDIAFLAGVQCLSYRAEKAVLDYVLGKLRFDHEVDDRLFWLPIFIWNVRSHSGFYKVAERLLMDLALVNLAVYCETEVYWTFPGSSDDFVAYNIATGTVRGYLSE